LETPQTVEYPPSAVEDRRHADTLLRALDEMTADGKRQCAIMLRLLGRILSDHWPDDTRLEHGALTIGPVLLEHIALERLEDAAGVV